MRIIAGKLGGLNFESPKGHRTHPMSDKVRGALFNMLGDIDGLSVFDAFAGSGALSFEAISRGASSVLAIDVDRRAQQTIKKNIESLKLAKQIKLVKAGVGSWSDQNPETRFDIVLVAPPYDDLQLGLVQKLVRHVEDRGILVLDWPGKISIPELAGMNLIQQKNYGDAQLVFYRLIS